ncbi:hypothetical protein C2G38_2036290 [Gigaspora rosea]|uniref:Uncharacterized protein n=1 Tax=Gigaspora rosea TaxID=44941 RepID=A0A397V9P2_9GLOM|nr:hypothetical protein C2G38_2036290 [Gigaspora rosea]
MKLKEIIPCSTTTIENNEKQMIYNRLNEILKPKAQLDPWKNEHDYFVDFINGLSLDHMNELSYNDPILSYIMDFDKFYCQIWRKDSEKDFTDSFTLPEIITSPLPSYLRTYIYDAVNSENAVPSESTLQTANMENSKDLFICRRILEEIFQIWKDKRYNGRRIGDSTINEGTYLRDFDFITKMTIRNVDENLMIDWAEKTSVSSEFRKTSSEESYNNQMDKKRSYGKKPDATAVFSLNSKISELFYLEGSGPPFIHDVQKWEDDRRKAIRLCNDSKNYMIAKFLDSFHNININHIKEIMEIPVISYQFYGTRLKALYFDQPLAYAPLIPIGRIFCIDEIDIPIEPVNSDEIINLIELIFKARGILKSSVDSIKKLIRELKNTKINRTKLRTGPAKIISTTMSTPLKYSR